MIIPVNPKQRNRSVDVTFVHIGFTEDSVTSRSSSREVRTSWYRIFFRTSILAGGSPSQQEKGVREKGVRDRATSKALDRNLSLARGFPAVLGFFGKILLSVSSRPPFYSDTT